MARLDVAKVVFGAFLLPWLNRRAFGRALAIPLVALVTLTASWHLAVARLSATSNWLLFVPYGALFTLFAVTCHRLVLLDPQSVASRLAPRWSWRESRFFLLMLAVWLIAESAALVSMLVAMTVTMTVFLNLSIPWIGDPESVLASWVAFAAKIPGLYVFARLCLVLPAAAVDRKVNLKWAWTLSKNNGWRLVLIVAVLPWILSQGVGLLYRSDASATVAVVLTFLGGVLLAVEVAALSLSYRELTREEAPRL